MRDWERERDRDRNRDRDRDRERSYYKDDERRQRERLDSRGNGDARDSRITDDWRNRERNGYLANSIDKSNGGKDGGERRSRQEERNANGAQAVSRSAATAVESTSLQKDSASPGPLSAAAPATTAAEKQKSKKEKLEAWKREREAKKAQEEAEAARATGAAGAGSIKGKFSKSVCAHRNHTSYSSLAFSAASIPIAPAPTTSINAAGLRGLQTKTGFAKGNKSTVSALDDLGDQKKQIEKFTLPPMDPSLASAGTGVEGDNNGDMAEDDDTDLVDDSVIQGNREDVTETLRQKRSAAEQAARNEMDIDVEMPNGGDVKMREPSGDDETKGGSGKELIQKEQEAEEDEEEDDPLEAFMAGVKAEVKQVDEQDLQRMGKGKTRALAEVVGARDEEPGDDEIVGEPDELDQAGTQDIMALAASKVKKKEIPTVDHAKVNYEPFRKEFYHPPAEVEDMSEEDAERLRMELDAIKVRGKDCPKPLTKWSYCGLPGSCLDVIKKLDYKAPTAIQSQAIPAIMSGRDIIGVAKTGSGKTMAFLIPMFRHIKDQRPVDNLEGPIGLIMTPTRELAVQIYRESRPFLKAIGLRSVCVYGGAPISEQIGEMKKTAEIVVATPGRMIDLLTANSGRVTNLRRVTYLVLDEADRMFDMGFEPQVMKIVNNIRPDRQTVLFSATFPKQMESLARKVLRNKPLEIIVGGRSVVAPEIEQIVEVREEGTKFNRLLEILGQTYNVDEDCRTLIFVERQESADDLLRDLMRRGYPTMSLHGGKDQVDRDSTISDFKAGVVPIVTATSVAARGLDVKQLKLVVNYDAPNHMEDYVHRAGRTGRAGNKGTCVTFITPEQDRYARDLISALKASKVAVPEELQKLADDFKEKVASGKAQNASSGFGGKGLERLENDREKVLAAQRSTYGEGGDRNAQGAEGAAKTDGDREAAAAAATNATEEIQVQKGPAPSDEQLQSLNIEVKKGAAPESVRDNRVREESSSSRPSKDQQEAADNALLERNKATLEAAKNSGADTTKLAQALARINAAALGRKAERAQGAAAGGQSTDQATQAAQAAAANLGHQNRRPKDPDSTDYHAIVPINDFPQRARWRVTNKETMSTLISETGASITNKGVFYEKGKEPQLGEPPKLQLLIESNDEEKVAHAVRDIKQLLLEATQAALEAEQRGPQQGRYSVL